MAKVLEKYRSVMVKALNALAQVEHLNFAKVLKEHFERVHTSLADSVALIERSPKDLIALKKRISVAKNKLKLMKQRGEIEEQSDKKVLKCLSLLTQVTNFLNT